MQRLTLEAPLTEKVARAQYRDDSLLALLRHKVELDLAALDEEDAIGRVALNKDRRLRLVLLC
jgi:hypothetical protein